MNGIRQPMTWMTATSLTINNSQLTINNSLLPNRQASFGYTSEELIVVLRPMLTTGQEPVGAMGDDTPVAAISKLPRPLFSYFKQRFAEVTNPPIDPLREELVMSTRVLLGRRANLLAETPAATRLIALKSPILLPEQIAALRAQPGPHFPLRDGARALAGAHRRRIGCRGCWRRPARGRGETLPGRRRGGARRRGHRGHQRRGG